MLSVDKISGGGRVKTVKTVGCLKQRTEEWEKGPETKQKRVLIRFAFASVRARAVLNYLPYL